jgi:hypothetical protein
MVYKSVPGFVLIVCGLNIVMYLISKVSLGFVTSLTSVPYYILLHFEFWRLFTSVFIQSNIFSLIIMLATYWSTGKLTEKTMGSVKYSIFMITNCVGIQIFYIFLSFFFNFISITTCWPIWGEIMIEIILLSKKARTLLFLLLCCPGKIKVNLLSLHVFCYFFSV